MLPEAFLARTYPCYMPNAVRTKRNKHSIRSNPASSTSFLWNLEKNTHCLRKPPSFPPFSLKNKKKTSRHFPRRQPFLCNWTSYGVPKILKDGQLVVQKLLFLALVLQFYGVSEPAGLRRKKTGCKLLIAESWYLLSTRVECTHYAMFARLPVLIGLPKNTEKTLEKYDCRR